MDSERPVDWASSTHLEVLKPLAETGLELNTDEKFCFVDSNERCRVYPLAPTDGLDRDLSKWAPVFTTANHRHLCLERFLAFHSQKIGRDDQAENSKDSKGGGEGRDSENGRHNTFLYLEFNGDREIYDTVLDPAPHEKILTWKRDSDFVLGSGNSSEDDTTRQIQEHARAFTDLKAPFTGVIVCVNQYRLPDFQSAGTTETPKRKLLHLQSFRINTFELFTEVLHPWKVQNRYGQEMIVKMSMYHHELQLANPQAFDFAPTGRGIEICIIDLSLKRKLIDDIVTKLLAFLKNRTADSPQEAKNDLLLLEFKNGDRDLFSAHLGTIRYLYYKETSIESAKDQPYYEKIKDKTHPLVIVMYVPYTDQVSSYAVSDRQ